MVLDAGGGGGDRRDRFAYMQVDAMWAMLRFHDSAPHYQALEGWKRSYELVLMHRTQVEKYKEKLITAWPPERNKAARAYVERLDHLIESLTETYDASIANYTAYSSALAAVDDIKRKLNTLQQEHAANTDALAKHEEELQDRPRAYGKAIAPPPPASPVAAGRQEELRLQAVGLMTGLTAELATAQTSLVAPKPYTPLARMDSSGDLYDPSGVSIPPLMSASTSSTGAARSFRTASPSRGSEKIITTPPHGGNAGPSTPDKNPASGPILGGTKQPVGPPPTSTPPTVTPVPPPVSAPDSFTTSPSQNPSSPSLPRHPPTHGSPMGNSPIGGTPSTTGTRGSSSLHGGVIGGTPPISGAPSGRAGQSGAGARGPQRINPLGGVIGHESVVAPSRRLASQSEREMNSQRWDPDNPWETEGGVDPVLLPQAEQRINPGPTIGGR
ncbi:hypothetical protein BC793_12715 [Actinoplanes xinjiangensis]|uniref:Uncharacterized protein n=1 Tax=Actinoplanes xinjiangensis TaxID=512350 RepID=A0A316ETP8_9ACTN|nr:hypothetical protein BC793_12715 [Actinoplanes xinjiangensis]GIF43114.1 hypothetical protein Axi01nite_74250 [Actinoplanes xinjiangensis]